MNTNTLVELSKSGDKQAFSHLVECHYDTIYATAWRWCGNTTNAEDITQNACLKLARQIHQFDGRSSFTTWLHRLVVNCAKDFYKSPTQHNVREQSHDGLDDLSTQQSDPPTTLAARQVLSQIGELASDLSDTLILVFVRGLNHHDAAIELGVKTSTVSWRIHEARKQLTARQEVPSEANVD